ncbi:MAG: heat-inducible transcriptional repressor HrcA [Chlamydiota bacterium]
MKRKTTKHFSKKDKEKSILIGLVKLFIQTGKPIGSNSLKESVLDDVSSATIRNYFGKLEHLGLLKQQHSSGGRIPTYKAFREYANFALDSLSTSDKEQKYFSKLLTMETREIASYLHSAIELLSEYLNCSVFLSAPRFDQDFVQDIKLLFLESNKTLAVLITSFGLIKTEIIYSPKPLTPENIDQMQQFFLWKLGRLEKPKKTSDSLLKLFQYFYNEVMVRHVISYAHFSTEDLYKTGLAKLLSYPEFNDPASLANHLSLFENPNHMLSLLRECMKMNRLTSWIGEELASISSDMKESTIITIPYSINQMTAGAIGILVPMRIPYEKFFATLTLFSSLLSNALTKSIYKYKISFRTPSSKNETDYSLEISPSILLENKSTKI